MSFKKYVRKRSEKIELIDEIKDIILTESRKEMSIYSGFKIDEIIKIFINIGYKSYFSGDMDIFEYFIDSLFELVSSNSEIISAEELLKYINYLGNMSIHNHNIIPFYTIITNIQKKIYELNELNTINNYLNIIKNLAFKSEKENFEIGILEILNKLKYINNYFIKNNLQINNIFLKNIIISLIYHTDMNNKEYLKNKIIAEIEDILK